MSEPSLGRPRPRRIILPADKVGAPEVATAFADWPLPQGPPGHLEHVEVAVVVHGQRLLCEGSVVEVDHQRKLTHLNPYWANLHPDPEPA